MKIARRATAVSLISLTVAMGGFAQSQRSGFFNTSDGVKIHYVEAGAGRPIVFIPGWTMPGWIWQNQIDEFAKHYHVVAVDPRSQGESDKPSHGQLPETRARDYRELVTHLGLKQPVLVGWSMACGELVKYAEQFGTDDVAGLVLVDGFIPDKPNPEMFTGMSGWMNQLQEDRRKQADGFVRSMYKKPQPEEYIKRVIDASMQTPADSAVVMLYNMIAAKDFTKGLARITRPVLFIHTPAMQPTADFLKSKLGDKVRLERFDGVGHALFVDDAPKFNRVLGEFIKSTSASVTYPHAFPREGVEKLFENDRVAVWKAIWPTGVKQPFHQHRYDMAAVYLRYGRVAVTTPDGKVVTPAVYEVPWPYFQAKGRLHKEEATSGPEQLAVMIDLKDDPVAPWAAPVGVDSAFPREGAKNVLENARVRMWDYAWRPGRPVAQHVHDKDSIEVFFEGGELLTRFKDGRQEAKTFHFADARFVPRGQVDGEESTSGSPRAVIVELK